MLNLGFDQEIKPLFQVQLLSDSKTNIKTGICLILTYLSKWTLRRIQYVRIQVSFNHTLSGWRMDKFIYGINTLEALNIVNMLQQVEFAVSGKL